MIVSKVPPGYVRALVERPNDAALVAAAKHLLGGADPTGSMSRYAGGDADTRGLHGTESVGFHADLWSITGSEQSRSGAASKTNGLKT